MRLVWSALVLALAVGCSEASLVSLNLDQEKKTSASIQTIAVGSVVSSEDEIALALSKSSPDLNVDQVKLRILDSEGKELFSQTLPPEALALPRLPPLKLSEMKTRSLASEQLLTLSIEIGVDGKPFKTQEVPFFLSDRTWGGFLVASHPQEIYPESTAILNVVFENPPPPLSYIRWKQGDQVLKEGTFGSGAGILKWKSPLAEGVYSLTAETFPVAPSGSKSFPFASTSSLPIRLVVTSIESYETKEFKPDESYLMLNHFRGNLRDSGVFKHGAKADKIILFPEPDLLNGFFGYDFSGRGGLENKTFLLPLSSEGKLQPFSLNARFMLRSADAGDLFFFHEISSDLKVQLRLVKDKGLEFLLESQGVQRSSVLEKTVLKQEVTLLTLSVLPLSDGLQLFWYWNGNLEKKDEMTVKLPSKLTMDGTSRIAGGDQGFPGVIDEAGVYFQDDQKRPNIDSDSFKRAMTEKYGSELELAEGFDGLFLPSDVTAEGPVLVREGRMLVHPGSSASLSALYPSAPDWRVLLPFGPPPAGEGLPAAAQGVVSLYYENETQPLLSVDLSGKYVFAGGSRAFEPGTSPLEIKLSFGEKVIECSFAGQEMALTPIKSEAGLIWKFSQNKAASAPFEVSDFLIVKEFSKKIATLSEK